MKNSYFQFKQFTVWQDGCAMKVCTDACLFGAWVAEKIVQLRIGINDILDIGTGTGLLSLMMAQKINAGIDAIETDGPAYEQAMENVASSAWKDRIKVIHGDVKAYACQRKYDLIISNPPFYENDMESPDDADNVARHSSLLTLHQLIDIAANNMSDNGYFAALLPYHRTGYVQALASSCHLHLHAKLLVRHSPAHPFFRSCILFNRNEQSVPVTDEISIKNGAQYSVEFSHLLKDYYLYL